MDQHDLLLTQNVAASGVEFSEKYVNVKKGSLLTGNASNVPAMLDLPTFSPGNKYYLQADSAEPFGLKWVAVDDAHDFHEQNTDTGTTSETFQIDSEEGGPKLKNISGRLNIRNDADAADAEINASKMFVSGGDPTVDNELARKKYVDDKINNVLGANDAMVFKGVIGTEGISELPEDYSAGWTYKVSSGAPATIAGQPVEVGDMVIAIADGEDVVPVNNAHWTVVQGNTEGVVIGPAAATSGNFPMFNGSSGRIIQNSPFGPTSFAPASHVGLGGAAHAIVSTTVNGFMSSSDKVKLNGVATSANNYVHPSDGGGSIPIALGGANVISSITVNTAGHVTATATRTLTPDNIGALGDWVAAPASKTSAGTAGQIARDDNFIYVCTQSGSAGNAAWKRSAIATNW